MKKAKKGNKVMGNKKKNLLKNILAAVLLFCVVILIIAIPEDNGSNFWSENELRITRQFNIILNNEKTQTVLNQEKEIIGEASEDVRKKVEELKSNNSNLSSLKELAELKEQGIITEKEFEESKRKILSKI